MDRKETTGLNPMLSLRQQIEEKSEGLCNIGPGPGGIGVSNPPGMSANPTITGNLLIHTFHCRLKSHSWKRFWDYDTFVV